MSALDRDRLLVHGDFSARNTIVRQSGGNWEYSVCWIGSLRVLDLVCGTWQGLFASSGGHVRLESHTFPEGSLKMEDPCQKTGRRWLASSTP